MALVLSSGLALHKHFAGAAQQLFKKTRRFAAI
jgi:hypothetical protein